MEIRASPFSRYQEEYGMSKRKNKEAERSEERGRKTIKFKRVSLKKINPNSCEQIEEKPFQVGKGMRFWVALGNKHVRQCALFELKGHSEEERKRKGRDARHHLTFMRDDERNSHELGNGGRLQRARIFANDWPKQLNSEV